MCSVSSSEVTSCNFSQARVSGGGSVGGIMSSKPKSSKSWNEASRFQDPKRFVSMDEQQFLLGSATLHGIHNAQTTLALLCKYIFGWAF